MEFACDKCGTHYAIPESRVVGRILKVRCKKCRSVVEVIGPPTPNPAGAYEPGLSSMVTPTKVDRAREAQQAADAELEHRRNGVQLPRQMSDVRKLVNDSAPDAGEVWFAGIKGQSTGPMSREDLIVLAQRGTVNGRTYVWRPGMSGWERVGSGKALGFLRDQVRARNERLHRPRRLSGMESGVFVLSGVFSPEAMESQARGTGTGVKALRAHGAGSNVKAIRAEGTGTGIKAIRSLMPEPEVVVAERVPVPPPLNHTGGSHWYVIDEPSQHDLWAHPESVPDVRGSTALMTGRHMVHRRRPWKVTTALLVVGTILAFMVGVVLTAWITRDGLSTVLSPPPELARTRGEAYEPSRDLVDRIRDLLDPSRGKGVRWPSVGGPEETVPDKVEPAQRPRVIARVREHRVAKPVVMDAVATPVGGGDTFTSRGSAGDLPSLPNSPVFFGDRAGGGDADLGGPAGAVTPSLLRDDDLTAEDVARVINGRRPQLEACYTAALKRNSSLKGSIEASIVIDRLGRVQRVAIDTTVVGAPQLAGCLKQRMRRWTFPQPSAELEVVLPLKLSAVH